MFCLLCLITTSCCLVPPSALILILTFILILDLVPSIPVIVRYQAFDLMLTLSKI